jgi:phenylacetate-coenzyme A ligase PaaK-like adenylate-forming protein
MINKVIPLEYQDLHDLNYTQMDSEATANFQNEALQKLIERVSQYSPFYQKKLKESGIIPEDLLGEADFQKLPFTYKEELREA